MTAMSRDALAIVAAVDRVSAQLGRLAEALTTPVVRPEVATDDAPTTPDDGARVHCPDCPDAPALQLHHIADHIVRHHTGEHQDPAADEEQVQRWARREPLLVLLTRLQRGRTLTEGEAAALRQQVETEMRDADTARAVASGNKRHVQVMYGELTEAQAAIERVRAVVTGKAQPTAAGISDHDIGQYDMAVAVLAALDGTEQTT